MMINDFSIFYVLLFTLILYVFFVITDYIVFCRFKKEIRKKIELLERAVLLLNKDKK